MSIRWENKLDFTGVDARVKTAAARGVQGQARKVLTESQRLVPLDTSELHDSGRVTGDGLEATVSYDTPYAVRQHEDLTLRHDNGRQAKYLEVPLRRAGRMDEVAAEIRGEIR